MLTESLAARTLLERIEDLRVFPPAAGRVLWVAQNPRSSLADMEEAVGSDPVLAGRVVALSNSAMYGRGQRVDGLRRAIQVLGFETTRDTAIALALASIGQRVDARWAHLWEHAVASARAARALAPYVGRDLGRRAFLCGLLHDIGRQLMAVVDPPAMGAVLDAEAAGHVDAMALERDAFGIDHAELGAVCLHRWALPAQVADAVAQHHQPLGLIGDPDDRRQVALLQLADAFAHGLAVADAAPGVLTYVTGERACQVLGLRRTDLDAVAVALVAEGAEGGLQAA